MANPNDFDSMTQEELDEAVHNAFSAMASDVNNAGPDAQKAFLAGRETPPKTLIANPTRLVLLVDEPQDDDSHFHHLVIEYQRPDNSIVYLVTPMDAPLRLPILHNYRSLLSQTFSFANAETSLLTHITFGLNQPDGESQAIANYLNANGIEPLLNPSKPTIYIPS